MLAARSDRFLNSLHGGREARSILTTSSPTMKATSLLTIILALAGFSASLRADAIDTTKPVKVFGK